jgi:hypothetical protein
VMLNPLLSHKIMTTVLPVSLPGYEIALLSTTSDLLVESIISRSVYIRYCDVGAETDRDSTVDAIIDLPSHCFRIHHDLSRFLLSSPSPSSY